ncbi:MAG: hypothetical protein ACE5KX_07375 [Acidimicrobiia bacterium]
MLTALLAIVACTRDGTQQTAAPQTQAPLSHPCEELAEAALDLIEDLLDAIDALPVAELLDAEQPPGELQQLERLGDDIDRRGAELDCDPVQLRRTVAEQTADLNPESRAAELLLELLRGG